MYGADVSFAVVVYGWFMIVALVAWGLEKFYES